MSTETAAIDQAVLRSWAHIWSPVAKDEPRVTAWELLGLPQSYNSLKADYWSTFHIGNPQPMIPLILGPALGMDASGAREDWLKIFNFLNVEWNDMHLFPDHLGVACDALNIACEQQQTVLAREMIQRYLLKWCERAAALLDEPEAGESAMAEIVNLFEEDLQAILEQAVNDCA